ncbi:uncharacterized protein LOC136094690 [Hydra vulgaris]|uniref:uncharacterized protein LOC136094690 n=1 Tax=Hydra vulgaris TaxID=6087 RepID=UPI0032EA60A7
MVVQSISQESTKVLSETATCKNILDFLDINDGIISLKYSDFTNSHFLQICKDKNKHNITLENLSLFFTTYCKYNISRVMLIRVLKKFKDYIVKLNRAKNSDLKKHFLDSALFFNCAFSDVVGLFPSDACSTPTSIYNSEIVPNQVTVFVSSDLNLQITNDELSCPVTPTSIVYIPLENRSENFLTELRVSEQNFPVSHLDKKLPLFSGGLTYQI